MHHRIARHPTVLDGVSFIAVAAFTLSFGDALVRIASAQLSIWQLIVLRSLVAVPVLLALMRRYARGAILPKQWLWVSCRSALMVAMWLSVYAAVTQLPLPTVSAALYTAPLWITLISALGPGRRLMLSEAGAVALGFIGVMCLLRPGTSLFSPLLWLPLAGALCYALAAVITATRCREESPLVLSLALNAAFLIIGALMLALFVAWPQAPAWADTAPFLISGWRAIEPSAVVSVAGLIAGLASIIIIANVAMARAYQIGPAPVIAAGDYSYLVFSGLWSLVLFDEMPTPLALLGIVLIIVAGLWAGTTGASRDATRSRTLNAVRPNP